jgi:hypothetical protein
MEIVSKDVAGISGWREFDQTAPCPEGQGGQRPEVDQSPCAPEQNRCGAIGLVIRSWR